MDASISESRLRAICKATGWKLSWSDSYFSEGTKYDADIFYDLLEPQGYGFTLDQRYIAEDVVAGMQTCLALDVSIADEHFTLRTLKPYNTEKTVYRTATVTDGTSKQTIIYREEEPDYLMHEIMRFAGHTDEMFVDIAESEDDMYWFVLMPAKTTGRDVAPMEFYHPTTTSPATLLAVTAQKAAEKYFYVPLFTSDLITVPNQSSASRVDLLEFDDGDKPQPDYYASQVDPGQTLHDAIRADLKRDFNYAGDFTILDSKLLGTARDKAGNKLPRLMVHIGTEHFPTNRRRVLGTKLAWQTIPTINVYKQFQLGFGLHTRTVE